ncbi:DUF6285 domain-containing protein [Noviherbaspirillum sp. Root189]|uniref:DUF6285 domain-containing protein n=1 Tax=Noviherbaspirillum sp. Root189 TaxID=1736487 RepID=UPI000709B169|nr:DUF6285 domain-containing protein [Noviherbaspirillum sp. Root189]KRB79912.1 hypothetical protein ASE07_25025 [Noviherbaspirillum sp. Root189]
MREQPSAPELIQAVADFLRDDALPRLDGLTAFHARVAVSLLEIVRRELELGPEADAQERARLQDLLGNEGGLDALNRELCERIARGEADARTPGLMPHLLRTGLDKLAVDQPGYSTYLRLQQHNLEGEQ